MFSLQSKLLFLAGIAILIAILFAIIFFYRGEAIQSEAENAAHEVTIATQNTTIAQGEQNVTAQKKAKKSAKKDQNSMAVIDQRIAEIKRKVEFFDNEDSATIRALIWHFNCSGVQPMETGCSNGADPSILQSTGEAVPVSVGEFVDACAKVIEYSHRWEEVGQCYEESMKRVK
jgi:hypothetical protein